MIDIALESAADPAWFPPDDEAAAYLAHPGESRHYKVALCRYLARLLPPHGPLRILDIGCGAGRVAGFLMKFRPETFVAGIEVSLRKERTAGVPIVRFDGSRIPFRDAAFDHALFLNVLHHLPSHAAMNVLVRESLRVTTGSLFAKDHVASSLADRLVLAALDVLGNWKFGVDVSGRYLSRDEWRSLCDSCGIAPREYSCNAILPPMLRKLVGTRLDSFFRFDRIGGGGMR